MEITYFIGNGFDLAMGLHTSYRDFIKHYLNTPSAEPCHLFLSRLIEEDVNTWSDAEVAMGKCTDNFLQKQEVLFCECYDDFVLSLSNFLKEADASCLIPSEIISIRHHYLVALTNLESFIPQARPDLKNALSERNNHSRHYSFLNFNYTQVFDRGLHVIGDSGDVICRRTPNICDTIGPVYHIHGKHAHGMVMGVDSDDQIPNKPFAQNATIRQRIIKPEVNWALNRRLVTDCKNTIIKSQIIVVFGMSIGKTDLTWWTNVGEWLRKDSSHQLIIFTFQPDKDKRLAAHIYVAERETQNLFLDYTALTPTDQDKVRTQITVVLNGELFGKNLFRLRASDAPQQS